MAICTDTLHKRLTAQVRHAVMATVFFAQAPSTSRQSLIRFYRRRLSCSNRACANLQRDGHVALPAQAQHAQDISLSDELYPLLHVQHTGGEQCKLCKQTKTFTAGNERPPPKRIPGPVAVTSTLYDCTFVELSAIRDKASQINQPRVDLGQL